MRYPVVLHTDDHKRYGVTVPDLAGCFSAGDSIDEALVSVQEAIALQLEGIAEEGGSLPLSQSIAQHKANPDYATGIWAVVEVDTARFEGKAEKINITLPSRLLVRIDAYAKSHHMSRSAFLAEAAKREMQIS